MWDPYETFKTSTLSNGLTLHASEWPGGGWQYLAFVVHSGAEHDLAELQGTAHFVEHAVSRNACMAYRAIKQWFEKHGGFANLGSTSFDSTVYRCKIPATPEHTAEALRIFASMLTTTRLTQEIESQRGVILEEWQRKFKTDFQLEVITATNRALRAGTSVASHVGSPLGTGESIARITTTDLQRYHDTHYAPENLSIVSVGGMSVQDLERVVKASEFGTPWKRGVRTARPGPVLTFPSLPKSLQKHQLSAQNPPIPAKSAAYETYARLPGTIKTTLVDIAGSILDELLFDQVREMSSQTYNISCEGSRFSDFWLVGVECGSFGPQFVDILPSLVEKCIVIAGSDQALFNHHRGSVVQSYEVRDLNGDAVCRGATSDAIRHNRITPLKEEQAETASHTFDELQNILTLLTPSSRLTQIFYP